MKTDAPRDQQLLGCKQDTVPQLAAGTQQEPPEACDAAPLRVVQAPCLEHTWSNLFKILASQLCTESGMKCCVRHACARISAARLSSRM